MNDLIERLRSNTPNKIEGHQSMREAADAIEAKKSEIERLTAALSEAPFELDNNRAKLDVAKSERDISIADVKRLRDLVNQAADIFQNCQVSALVCCFVGNMEGHAHPMSCGHSPVDMWEYAVRNWITAIQRKEEGQE